MPVFVRLIGKDQLGYTAHETFLSDKRSVQKLIYRSTGRH
jgi:hypothetical protein